MADCSIVVDALVARDGEQAAQLLAGHRLSAPHLIDVEIVSALRALVLRRELDAPRATGVLIDYEQLAITRWSSADDLRSRAFDLRDDFSAYDAAYVVLAEALDCPLATRDLRLARSAGKLVDVLMV